MTDLKTLMAACPNFTLVTVGGSATSITTLMDSIDLANNGYVPVAYMDAPTLRALDKAKERGLVIVTNGMAHRPTTEVEFYPTAPGDAA